MSYAFCSAIDTTAAVLASPPDQKEILYGAAYEEYAPYDRFGADVKMMKAAGINVIRIAESTWGTLEPSRRRVRPLARRIGKEFLMPG